MKVVKDQEAEKVETEQPTKFKYGQLFDNARKISRSIPMNISDLVNFDMLYVIKGKSGLWTPLTRMAGSNKFAFERLGDPSQKVVAHNGYGCMGVRNDIKGAFDLTFIRGKDVEDHLKVIDGIKKGEIKKFAACYHELIEFIENQDMYVDNSLQSEEE